ncbi:MAG: hypothetical protein A2V70_18910 [Planctomycetes bacterium RBG_13_63_9]|nr:MAG: hypothetical protein A2V70_18910 [Planctomycetes bacterium RBG_13_63_9]
MRLFGADTNASITPTHAILSEDDHAVFGPIPQAAEHSVEDIRPRLGGLYGDGVRWAEVEWEAAMVAAQQTTDQQQLKLIHLIAERQAANAATLTRTTTSSVREIRSAPFSASAY